MTTFTETFASKLETGRYVFTTDRDGGVYAGSTLKGWVIEFRRGNRWRGRKTPLHKQRQTFRNPSLFGALRQIIRDGRAWSGRVFTLEILSAKPILEAHYEYPEDND